MSRELSVKCRERMKELFLRWFILLEYMKFLNLKHVKFSSRIMVCVLWNPFVVVPLYPLQNNLGECCVLFYEL